MALSKNWRNRSVTIKFKDLNPKAQEIIAGKDYLSIKARRSLRFSSEITLAMQTVLLATTHSLSEPFLAAIATLPLSSGARALSANLVQIEHRRLARSLETSGVVNLISKDNYPKGWTKSSTVAVTHPTFYVKRNGDLVFLRTTRMEYARYLFQKKKLGKLGLNAWRWRAYLKSPKAPKKAKDWVKRKIAEWAANLPQPKRRPGFALTTAKLAPPKTRKRRP